MSLNVNIKYKDAQNWTNDAGQIINWSSYHQTFKAERVEHNYLAAEVFTDIWNGRIHDVQHIRWDVWRLEFTAKESEIQELSRMQSCDSVIIEDIENGLNHTVNMQTSEWLNFAEPERQADTTNWKLILIYRTNKTIINKFKGLDDAVALVGGDGTYNSKYEKISYDGELIKITTLWDATDVDLQESHDIGFKVLLYLSDSEKETFKNDWNQNDFTIDGTPIIKTLPLEITVLGEDNYQIIVSCVTQTDFVNLTTAMSTVSTLTIDVTTVIYESKFNRLIERSETEYINIDEPGLSSPPRTLRESRYNGYKQLFYWTKSELDGFSTNWNGTDIDRWAWGGVISVDTRLLMDIEETINGLYIVTVHGYFGISINTHPLAPNTTHELIITDTGGPYTFHTDYPTEANTPDAEKDDFSNEDGLPVDAKIISRQVTDIKLFLNTSDKNSLKLHYEKGTAATIDAVPILYRGIVDTNEMDKDLWEVDIKGLTTTPLVTYPL